MVSVSNTFARVLSSLDPEDFKRCFIAWVQSFEPLVPNKETIATIRAARNGELVTVEKVEDLLGSLNEND